MKKVSRMYTVQYMYLMHPCPYIHINKDQNAFVFLFNMLIIPPVSIIYCMKKIREYLVMCTRAPNIFAPTLQRHNTENKIKKYSQKRNWATQSQFLHSSICERFTYIFPVCLFATGIYMYVDGSWEYKNRSQTHGCGNWDWGPAILFLRINKWDFCCRAIPLNISTVCSISSVYCLQYCMYGK